MDDFYSREITLADMPFLMHEFEEGARLGHFTNEIITPAGGKKFENKREKRLRRATLKVIQAISSSSCFVVQTIKNWPDLVYPCD